MMRVISFFLRARNSAASVKLDPEEGYDTENEADHQQKRTAKYEPYEALLLRSGMSDTKGSYKRFHQKVENAIHSVPQILSGKARLIFNAISTGCASLSILYVFLAPSLCSPNWNGYDG
jgi:hypothetical protein